jgi:hypothetical protein
MRIGRFGFADKQRERPLNEAQRPHFRSVHVALGSGYSRVRGIGRARELIFHPNPNPIRAIRIPRIAERRRDACAPCLARMVLRQGGGSTKGRMRTLLGEDGLEAGRRQYEGTHAHLAWRGWS